MKTIVFSLILAVGLASGIAHADDFLTQDEIQKSSLTETEKGLAFGALLSKSPVIECVSPNEGIGQDSERLRIYFIQIGNVFQAGVAVWKTNATLKVFGNFENIASLVSNYEKNASSVFGSVDNQFSDHALTVKYGRIVPLVGKVTELTFNNSVIASQICKISK
jgi:hypothetical protein